MPEVVDVSFLAHGETCAGWHLTGEGDAFAGDRGRPCVVMAHGFAATRDSGLLPFAEAFAEAGLDTLLFDYRCFGDSSGEPRQFAMPSRHRDDYRAAVEFARGLDGVDPERIVLWGTSWSGGHVVYVAAGDPRIAAIVCQTPDLDGVRALEQIRRYAGLGHQLRLGALGVKDGIGSLFGREPVMVPVVGRPGELAVMSSDEAEPGMRAIAGPTWRNEVTARGASAEMFNRPITKIDQVRCPILVQIADRDSVAPAAATRAAAWRAKGRVEVREYPLAHFDIYVGGGRDRAVRDQLQFLRRHLGAVEAEVPAALSSQT
ncbi:MAG: alpha/beta hydrolase [Solirubrobacterales bacterium]